MLITDICNQIYQKFMLSSVPRGSFSSDPLSVQTNRNMFIYISRPMIHNETSQGRLFLIVHFVARTQTHTHIVLYHFKYIFL